jgi:hypothetical protein
MIERCLSARRPGARYPDTATSAWTIRAVKWMPDRVIERVVRKIAGQ